MSQLPPTTYGAPSGGRPHRGTMILVFGILSWVLCFIFGILAWVMGNNDLQAMQRGEMDRSGEGMTKAGKIIGMINVILCIIFIPLYIIIMVLAVGAGVAGSSGGGSP